MFVKSCCIYTGDDGAYASSEYFAGESTCILPPEHVYSLHLVHLEEALTVGTHIFEEDIAKGDVTYALKAHLMERIAHAPFVFGIGAWIR